jgi:hypothetical protein
MGLQLAHCINVVLDGRQLRVLQPLAIANGYKHSVDIVEQYSRLARIVRRMFDSEAASVEVDDKGPVFLRRTSETGSRISVGKVEVQRDIA